MKLGNSNKVLKCNYQKCLRCFACEEVIEEVKKAEFEEDKMILRELALEGNYNPTTDDILEYLER